MKAVSAGIWITVLLAAAGCSTSKVGILGRLPDPVFASAPARPPVAPPDVKPIRDLPRSVGAPDGWLPPGGVGKRWTCVVIHHSAGDSGGAVAFDRFHKDVRGWDELGYHFVIGNGTNTHDGQVEVGPRWTKQKHGAHCKTSDNSYNDHGIGICLVGNFEHSRPSPAQMESLEKLVRFLMAEFNIPLHRVLTHRGVTGKTACPGRKFPLAALKRNLSASVTAAAGYH